MGGLYRRLDNRSRLLAQQHGQTRAGTRPCPHNFLIGTTAMPGCCHGAAARRDRRPLSRLALRNHAAADHGSGGEGLFREIRGAWPTVEALAAAPLDDVLKAWAGLGYYARARNLHACARDVVSALRRQIPGDRGRNCAACPASAPIRRAPSPPSPSTSRMRRSMAMSSASSAGFTPSRRRCRRRNPKSAHAPGAGAAAPGRRFRASDDGLGRHHLHAEIAQLPDLSVDGALRRQEDPASPPACRARRPKKPVPTRHGVAFWIERDGWRGAAAPPPGEGPARRHDGSAVDGVGRDGAISPKPQAPLAAEWTALAGPRRPHLHAFPSRARR